MHLINWKTINLDKNRGGLGIQDLGMKNVAMLAKWWWKAKIDRGKFWHNILKAKYGEDFLSSPRIACNDISPIVQSIAGIKDHDQLKLFRSQDFRWTLGNGATTRFWKDPWYERSNLEIKFKQLYLLHPDHFITVREMVHYWSVQSISSRWRRPLRGGETQEDEILSEIIKEIRLGPKQDVVSWRMNNEIYTSTQGYKILQGNTPLTSFWSLIWKL